jgi:hypothetical protein
VVMDICVAKAMRKDTASAILKAHVAGKCM